jgi:hypothetical protein
MNSIRNVDYKMNEFDFDKTLITIHKRTIKNNQKYYSIPSSHLFIKYAQQMLC